MKLFTLMFGAFLGALSVILGAMGAHLLKKVLDAAALSSFETGVRYQMYHAIVLVVIGLFFSLESSSEKWTASLFMLGTVFFSWSIFGLVLFKNAGINASFLGPITPIGGTLLIAAWVMLGYLFWVHFHN